MLRHSLHVLGLVSSLFFAASIVPSQGQVTTNSIADSGFGSDVFRLAEDTNTGNHGLSTEYAVSKNRRHNPVSLSRRLMQAGDSDLGDSTEEYGDAAQSSPAPGSLPTDEDVKFDLAEELGCLAGAVYLNPGTEVFSELINKTEIIVALRREEGYSDDGSTINDTMANGNAIEVLDAHQGEAVRTVFVPTNRAFAQLWTGSSMTEEEYLESNLLSITEIILQHLSPDGSFSVEQIVDATRDGTPLVMRSFARPAGGVSEQSITITPISDPRPHEKFIPDPVANVTSGEMDMNMIAPESVPVEMVGTDSSSNQEAAQVSVTSVPDIEICGVKVHVIDRVLMPTL